MLDALDAAVGPDGTLMMVRGTDYPMDWVYARPPETQMALCIGELTGTAAESWVRMRGQYGMKIAERAMADKIAKIPTPREAA